jgi:ribonuclease HI
MTQTVCLVLHFDGSHPPGRMARYGWHLDVEEADSSLTRLADDSGPLMEANMTCNLAEWRALQSGLGWVARLRLPVEDLVIVGDSQLVLNQLTGEWACKKPSLVAVRDACREMLDRMRFPWRAIWVPRDRNAEADRLSKRGVIKTFAGIPGR